MPGKEGHPKIQGPYRGPIDPTLASKPDRNMAKWVGLGVQGWAQG